MLKVSLGRLEVFKRTALPGDRLTYFTGYVSLDNCLQLEPLLASAWAGYATGMFDLVQRRVPRGRFDHDIVRRAKRAEILLPERVGYTPPLDQAGGLVAEYRDTAPTATRRRP